MSSLVATPGVHLRDVRVRTTFDADYRDARLDVRARLKNFESVAGSRSASAACAW